MDPPQLPWQTFDSQQTLSLSTAAAAAAQQFYMQDYINSSGSGFNSFQQLHSSYPSLPSAESTSTTPASTSSVSPGTIASIGSISSLGLQTSPKPHNVVCKSQPKMQRKRKKKDPNEPQKPVSAYALFFRDTQSHIKSQIPNATFGEISKIVASKWDQLETNQKEIYKKKTEAAKKEYLRELAAYRASLVQSPHSSHSPHQSARSPLSAPSISSFQSSLGQNFNANLMNGFNSSLSFSQSNGNLASMAMPMAMGGQAMANLANFSQMGSQWTQDSAKLGFGAQNWPPAAHSNSNMHSMYLGSQMHALSSQLGMSPWDHRTR